MEINEIVKSLYEARQVEAAAKAVRVGLEEELAAAIGVPEDWEGSKTNAVGDFKVKLTRKINVQIDDVRLRELARVNNLTALLDRCFRWKPEIVKKEWGAAPEKEKLILSGALKFTPGKASFNVTPIEAEAQEATA